ncbi:MAG: hypothetical protein HY721_34840 [Planctomycetes bacterium]|nr:hypothetical protein [Planctomycetota bacterium]
MLLSCSVPPECRECPPRDPDCDKKPGEPEPDADQQDPQDDGLSSEIRPRDANEKHGPSGWGEARVVAVGEELAYTVYFEKGTAWRVDRAPCQTGPTGAYGTTWTVPN